MSDEELRVLERRLRAGDEMAMRAFRLNLVRLGRVTEDQADLLDAMGPKAWVAWSTGGEYEERPESAEFGDSYAEFIEPRDRDVPDEEDPHGDGTWTSGWSVGGIAVRRHSDGSPVIVRTHWTVDRDGNWDATGEDEWPVGSAHDELDQAERYRDNRRSWVEYFAWMAGTLRDPIGDIVLPTRRSPSTKWRFTLTKRANGVYVTKAVRRWNRKWAPVPMLSLPEEVWQWLSAEQPVKGRKELATTVEDLDDIRANNKVVKDTGDSVVIETVIEGRVLPPSDREMADAARRHEVRAGEELAQAEREVERMRGRVARCERCEAEIERDEEGAWVDVTDGDDCDGGVHVPAVCRTCRTRILGSLNWGEGGRGPYCDACA